MVSMKKNAVLILWFVFIMTAVLTRFLYFQSYPINIRAPALLIMAAINFAQGVWILVLSQFDWKKVLIVTCIFLMGQWWFFLWSAIFIVWGIRGFAP